MGIKSDKWIRRMALEQGMIWPFEPSQVKAVQPKHHEDGPHTLAPCAASAPGAEKIVSYGTSSYGYDVRCDTEFKIFTNINSTIVDPKHFDEDNFVTVRGNSCIIPPNSFALGVSLERFKIPRDVLTICLGKSTYARCFSGDTRVALVDGSAPTLEDMSAGALRGEKFFGYSVDHAGHIHASELCAPRYVGQDSLLEIELDNGELIECTPDHEFLMRDGSLRPAQELTVGASLMPLYRGIARGYEVVFQQDGTPITPTHWLVDSAINPDPMPAGTHRHHIDGNRRNNHPANLERVCASTHVGQHMTEYWSDPARREEQRAKQAQFWSENPQMRDVAARRSKAAWVGNEIRRAVQADHAGNLRLRQDITEEAVRDALRSEETVRGAARLLGVDRSAFRRFPRVIADHKRNHKVVSIRELPGTHEVYCLTVPHFGNFALEAGVFVKNCGVIVNVTPLEPEWEGHITMEFSNTTPLPARIYANEGCAQLLFLGADLEIEEALPLQYTGNPTNELSWSLGYGGLTGCIRRDVCETSYADRGGKYQNQVGVTLPTV